MACSVLVLSLTRMDECATGSVFSLFPGGGKWGAAAAVDFRVLYVFSVMTDFLGRINYNSSPFRGTLESGQRPRTFSCYSIHKTNLSACFCYARIDVRSREQALGARS